MTKMGYEPGKGLGKDGEGCVEQVPIQLLPQGTILTSFSAGTDCTVYPRSKNGQINLIKKGTFSVRSVGRSTFERLFPNLRLSDQWFERIFTIRLSEYIYAIFLC